MLLQGHVGKTGPKGAQGLQGYPVSIAISNGCSTNFGISHGYYNPF